MNEGDAARDELHGLLDAFVLVRRRFYQGAATHAEAVAAAEAYRAAMTARKLAEPHRFRGLSIPSVARLMRG